MKRQLYLLLLLLFSFSTQAQEEWSLLRCIEHAIDNNLTIKQAEISIGFAGVDQTQAKHDRFPSLSFGTSLSSRYGRSTNPITNTNVTQNFISNNLSLNTGIVLFNGFRITNSIKQADINKKASEYDYEQSKRDISLSVANAYLSVLFADENLAIANSQLSTSEEQLKQTQKLIDAGVRPANEALDIQAQIAMNEQAVINAENSKEISLLNLKQLLRLEPDVSMTLSAPLGVTVDSDPDVLTFLEVYNSAIQSQYDVKAADLRVEAANIGEKIAQSGLMPSLNLFASMGSNYVNAPIITNDSYVDQLNDNLSYGFGVSLNYPIYSNYANRSNVERAKLSTQNASNQSEQVRDGLKTTVQQALADARNSKRKLNAAQKSVEAQTASFNNAEKRFNAGTINSFEYVSIKNALLEAQVNAVLSKYEYLFATKVLDFYMGKPINI